jgi:tRNA dimethylallyltransferase
MPAAFNRSQVSEMSPLFSVSAAINVQMGMTNPRKRLGLIAGPTASGKTALALAVAAQRDVTIINADSAQVYAHLPVLSAQPTAEEKARCPHRLFGYLDGSEACSAARWAGDAKKAIAEGWDAGRLPLLVGGTGLYLRTLLEGIAPIPEISADIRKGVRELETGDAYAALLREDAVSAAALNPQDDSRIKRALEVIRSTGRSIADWRGVKKGGIGDAVSLHPLILLPPRDWLHARCDARFEAMMAGGAVEEVLRLLELDLPNDAPVLRTIGVPEIRAMLDGRFLREEAVALGQAATRQYAKRQYTWFRNQPPADWPRWNEAYSDSEPTQIERLFQF